MFCLFSSSSRSLPTIGTPGPYLSWVKTLLISGIGWFLRVKQAFMVRVSSGSGEVEAFVTEDKDHVQQVANTMNEAIIKRG